VDSHPVVACAIPAKGHSTTGEMVDCFAFLVSHPGTMPISSESKAGSMVQRNTYDATLITRRPLSGIRSASN
jgi:hypothetical protein